MFHSSGSRSLRIEHSAKNSIPGLEHSDVHESYGMDGGGSKAIVSVGNQSTSSWRLEGLVADTIVLRSYCFFAAPGLRSHRPLGF